jgi:transposase-like protein
MSKSVLEAPEFRDPEAARAVLETELWPNGPVCGHCGSLKHYATKKPGRYRCGEKECRKDFTVTTKTVMESSHIELHKWLQGFHLAASSKKGFSAHQLSRTLKISYKAAWFMEHRIREAMRSGGLQVPPLGGKGSVVEVDETYHGVIEGAPRKGRKVVRSPLYRRAVLSLVERGGKVRSFHVPVATKENVMRIVMDNIHYETVLHTDESGLYKNAGWDFAGHNTVVHSKGEYVRRTDRTIHTNTVEGYFSVFKRGMSGVYQHCGEKHLHRYLAEFDFRYNHRAGLGYDDEMRASLAIKGAANKRLYFKKPSEARL